MLGRQSLSLVRCWPAITSRFPSFFLIHSIFFFCCVPSTHRRLGLFCLLLQQQYNRPEKRKATELSSGGIAIEQLFMNKYCINNLTCMCLFFFPSAVVSLYSFLVCLFWRPPRITYLQKNARRSTGGMRGGSQGKIEEFSKLNCYSLQQVFLFCFGGGPRPRSLSA